MTAGTQVFERDSRPWNLKRLGTSNLVVPATQGIYVLSHLTTFEGFPVQWEHVYVGRTIDLRRRLDEHTPHAEAEPRIRRYIVRHLDTMWVWYTTQLMLLSLEELERSIIRRIQPRFNVVHNASVSQSIEENEL